MAKILKGGKLFVFFHQGKSESNNKGVLKVSFLASSGRRMRRDRGKFVSETHQKN